MPSAVESSLLHPVSPCTVGSGVFFAEHSGRAHSCRQSGSEEYFRESMSRRSVLPVVTALALAISGSAYAELVGPVLRVGETQTFTPSQFQPAETMACVGGGGHVTASVPTVTKAEALAAAREGYHWGNLRLNDGLSLSIAVNRDRSIVVECSSTALPTPHPYNAWGTAMPNPDLSIPTCKAGEVNTAANPCTKSS
jgi:hypothetical protein